MMAYRPRLFVYLGSILLPIILIVLEHIKYDSWHTYAQSVTWITLFVIGIIAKIVTLVASTHYIYPNHSPNSTGSTGHADDLFTKHYRTIGVIAFGCISLWLRLISSLNTFYCYQHFQGNVSLPTVPVNATCRDCDLDVWFDPSYQRSLVVWRAANTVYYILTIPHLLHMCRVQKRTEHFHWSEIFVLLDIFVNVAVWTDIFLVSSEWIPLNDVHWTGIQLETRHDMCLFQDTPSAKFMNLIMDPLFYTCLTEMSLNSIEILSHVWFAPLLADTADDSAEVMEETDNQNTTVQRPHSPNFIKLGRFFCGIWTWLISMNTLPLAFIVMVINAAMQHFFSMNYDAFNENESYIDRSTLELEMELPLATFRVALCCLPFCAVSLHCFMMLRKSRGSSKRCSNMTITYIILIICCVAEFIFDVSKIIIGALCVSVVTDEHTSNLMALYMLSIIEAVLFFTQHMCQFGIIYTANSYNPKKPIAKIEALLYYLAAFNFCDYAVISMTESKYLAHRVETHGQYLPAWKGVVHVTLPFISYFRYMGVFLILDVKSLLVNQQKNNATPDNEERRGGRSLNNVVGDNGVMNEESPLLVHAADIDEN